MGDLSELRLSAARQASTGNYWAGKALALIDRVEHQDQLMADDAAMLARSIILIHDELDGGWVADCGLLPGCVSQGETAQEALENVMEAAVVMVRVLTDSGERTSLEDVIATLGFTQAELDAAGLVDTVEDE